MSQKLPKRRKCGLLKRVSSSRQAMVLNGSIDTQDDLLRSAIAMKSTPEEPWEFAEEYEEEGVSAKTWKRPEIQRLISDIKAGKVNTIVVYKLDRLIRGVRDFYELWGILEPLGTELYSVTESFDTTTPMGRAMLNLLLTFGQLEREQTSARTRDKMRWRSEQGFWNGGCPPLGYKRDDKQKGVLIVVPAEAELVQLIFKKYLELGSATRLVRWLGENGYRTPTRTSKQGKTTGGGYFHKSAVLEILTSHVYVGSVGNGGCWFKGRHEGIVPEDLFERVQAALGPQRKRRKNLHAQRRHCFTLEGKLRCGGCFSRLTPKTCIGRDGKPYHYYQCTKNNSTAGLECSARYVPAAAAEEAILGEIRRIALAPDEIDQITREANEESNGALGVAKRERAAIDIRLKAIGTKIRTLIGVLTQDGADRFSSVKEELHRLETDKTTVEGELRKLDQEIDGLRRRTLDRAAFTATLRTFSEIVDRATPEERRALVGQVLDYVVWTWTEEGAGHVEMALYDQFRLEDPGPGGPPVPASGRDATGPSSVRLSGVNGSPGRTRTCSLAVNSRSLYH